MLENSLPLALSTTIVTAGIGGLVLFLWSFRKSSSLHTSTLRNWGLGFFFLTWIRVPTVLVLAGWLNPETVKVLMPFFSIGTVAMIAAYVLFYRGTVMLLTKNNFWVNILPISIFVLFSTLVSSLLLLFHVSIIISIFIVTIFVIISVIVITGLNFHLLLCFCRERSKKGSLVIIIGWVLFLLSHIYITGVLNSYPADLWFFALTSSPTVYIYSGFTISHIVLLVGFIMSHTHNKLEHGTESHISVNP